MQLNVWGGSWGLPSVDPDCLAIMAYCKFANVPVKIEATNSIWNSPTGRLPVLHHEEFHSSQVKAVFQYLRAKNYGCEFELTIAESADMMSFLALVEEKLTPAMKHSLWLDSKIFTDVTRPWYGKAVGFPFSLYYPNNQYSRHKNTVYNAHPNLSEDDIDTKIYKDARDCMKHLSSKLAKNEFFFGSKPTALDAVVFGYIAILNQPPFHNNPLTRYLNETENLVTFINRIRNSYFKQEIEDMRIKDEDSKKEHETNIDDFPNTKRNMVLAGLVAISSMIGYAVISGLVQIEFVEEDDSENELQEKPLPIPKFENAEHNSQE